MNNDQDTPLFVLEPNPNSFESLVRNYRKAAASNYSFPELLQDSYFEYKFRIPPKEIAKVICTIRNYRNGINIFFQQNIHVYSAPMKPWNFHTYSDIDWKKHYDPVGFYKWRRINNDVRHLLDPCMLYNISPPPTKYSSLKLVTFLFT